MFWSKVDGYDSRLPARAPHPVYHPPTPRVPHAVGSLGMILLLLLSELRGNTNNFVVNFATAKAKLGRM